MEEKNYLDIEATATQVKKAIEEVVEKLTDNPKENTGKYFQLQYNEEETDELNAVSIVLNEVDSTSTIDGRNGQIIVSDGDNWVNPSQLFSTYDSPTGEVRLGPLSAKTFLITGNPTKILNTDGTPKDSTTYNLKLSDRANVSASNYSILNLSESSSLKMSDYSNAYFKDSGLLQLSGKSNVSFDSNNLTALDGNTRFTMHDNSAMDLTRGSQIFAHGPVQLHIDDGKYYSRITVYSRLYYSDIGGRPSPDLTAEEIRSNPATTFSSYGGPSFSTIEELIAAGYVLEENNSFSKYSTYYYLSDTFVSVEMKSHYSGYNSTDSYLNGAAIRMHDKALLSMDSGASIIAHDTPKIYFEDNAKAYIRGDSYLEIDGTSKTYIKDNSNINMTNNATLVLQNDSTYDPCLYMNGGTILFNAGDESNIPYDPYLIAEPNQITYIGQAATGVNKSSYYNYPKPPEFSTPKMIKFEGSFTFTDTKATQSVRRFDDFTESNKEALISALRSSEYNIRTSIVKGSSSVTSTKLEQGYSYTVSNFYYSQGGTGVFGDLNNLVPENDNPRFRIANESMIIVDTSSGRGANYIRIGAADKLLQIIKMGNIFEQMTGNAHSEMHDDSCFIMRGTTTTVPWKEGMKPDQWTKTHLDKSWYRPITTDNGPLFSMYDKSQFIMRGNWDYSEEYSIYSSNFTFIDENIEIAPVSIETMTEETRKKFFNAINKTQLDAGEYTLYNNLKDAYDEETGELLTTISSTLNPGGGLSLTISKFKYNSVPENWSEFLEKVEGQSLLEVIENAEVRIKGDSVLKMNDFSIVATSEGISFGNGENSVTFSIEELKKLKTFLSNSEIEE